MEDVPPAAAAPAAGQAPAKSRQLSPRTRNIAIAVIVVLALVVGGIFGVTYLLNARNFVTTDNANVDGLQIAINAPGTGTLVSWSGLEGTSFQQGQVLGRIRLGTGSGVQPVMNITAPSAGIIAVNNGVVGAFVTAGTSLATAYNLDQVYVTARVQETDVNDVHPGQAVDISVDAFPGTPLTGTVEQVGYAASSQFSLFPQNNSSGNFQKVTQVIPVKIDIDNQRGLPIVPGMNVTVKIHRT